MNKENPWGKDGTRKDVDLHLYRSMIGSLMYLTASRPTSYPKSTTGGCQVLGRRLISWQCKKQTIMATSTTKAEYVVAASCCGQVLWIQNQLLDYGLSMPCEALSREFSTSILHLTVPLFAAMLVHLGEGSGTPTEPHPTPSPEAPTPLHTTHPSSLLPPITTTSILSVTPTETTPIRQYTRRTRIAQSSVPPTIADEPASPQRDVSQGEACPTDFDFIVDRDRATIDKSSTLPYDLAPRLTSPTTVEGSMQHTIPELTALCTSLQRQLSELTDKFQAQEVEINRLKERVKQLEEREGVAVTNSGDDVPIKGRSMDEEEAATERVSDDTEEMATVLTSMDAATVLASGVVDVPTGSGSIPTASTPAEGSVPTGSEEVPTTSLVFVTATVVTPVTRRKCKEVMVESETPKKQKVQEQIDAQGMTFEEVEAKFNSVCKQIDDFIHMGSKEEAERIKRKGINLEQESVKKQKSSEEITEEAKSLEEVPEEKVKEMMNLVPIKEVYVEALQVKHPIIDWKVHSEGQRSYWKITRLGGSLACYQFFIDLLKHLDREDLNQLWKLVKETLSTRPPTSDKKMELWVEINRLYEPDEADQLQRQRNLYTCGEGLPSKEGFSTCDDLLPTSSIKFPLVEEVPTASVEGCHYQKKSKATARKIALLC
uniref:Ribonuclease H-like domain, reverse transcriptase, RNA-dependent DNA polymerase n=1 Tax=Tanacetum cinerariifolium TaxID=118510 RepID=A0A699HZD8_TANCI|nr:ribonuclease H-like domain, reverse transcriptase, RNA-dependent DNA polymerase [Tanacetum cinerariifolium]